MGALISFDKMTMNWLNDGAYQSLDAYSSSSVFQDKFEDPTYMTFRIEFGGWGASTIPPSMFREMQRSTNGQATESTRRAYSFNYDDYPQGLLDLNFAKNSITSRPFDSFNMSGTYNAYNWLLNRNEDNRAAYLKTFIEGIYEIQRQYPYLFQEISGLDSLSDFNSARGTRLANEAVITLKCIEGLSRKIYTLMQCYAKAAWDAEYQRWILPENYRQFKMIIYVFERRVFHSVREWKVAQQVDGDGNNKEQGKNFGGQLVDFLLAGTSFDGPYGPVSDPPITIGAHSVNSMVPVMAYECNLCEFAINSFGSPDSISAAWNNGDSSVESTISIKVKNCRTYYKNGLLQGQLASMVIGDLVNVAERHYDPEKDAWPTGDFAYIQRYLDRNIVYQDDIGPGTRPGFGGGGAGTGNPASLKGAFDTMVNNWKNVLGTKSDSSSAGELASGENPAFYESKRDAYLAADDLTGYRNENWWADAVVNPPSGGGSFWKKLGKLITAGTQHVRLPPGYSIIQANVFNNILDYLDYSNTLGESYMSYATRDGNFPPNERSQLMSDNFNAFYKYKSTATADGKNPGDDDTRAIRASNMRKDNDIFDTVYEKPDPAKMDSLAEEHDEQLRDFYDNGAFIGDPNVEMSRPEEGYEYDSPDELGDRIEDIDFEPQDIMNDRLEYPDYVYPNDTLETLEPGIDIQPPQMTPQEPGITIQKQQMTSPTAGVTPPVQNMAGQYEYPDYVYPNDALETLEPGVYEPVLIGGEIDTNEGFIHDEDVNFQLDAVIGSIEVVDKNGEIGELTPVERPDLALTKEGNIVLDADDALKVISMATSEQDMEFTQIDEAFKAAESMVGDIVKDANTLVGIELPDKITDSTSSEETLASLAYDAEIIKREATNRIAEMQEKLRAESAEVIRSSDRLEVSKATKAEDLGKTFIEVNPAVVSQLEDNIALFSIPRPAIGQMSIQTMVGIERGLEAALMNTSALVEVLHTTNDRSIATDLDGGPNTSTMNEGRITQPRQSKTSGPLIG